MEENELFVVATKEGLSKEAIRKICVSVFDYYIKNVDWEQISESMIWKLMKKTLREMNKELTDISGEDIFELLEEEIIDEMCSPEVKKHIIFGMACDLVIEKGNISFNTAIKRSILKLETDAFISYASEEIKRDVEKIIRSINPMIDFYFKNELELITAFYLLNKEI